MSAEPETASRIHIPAAPCPGTAQKIRKEPLFPAIIGFEKTVIPAIVNAVLAKHDIMLLGLRGQLPTVARTGRDQRGDLRDARLRGGVRRSAIVPIAAGTSR